MIFRAAVLFAVLSGLLFSCSEGIRLFPFPFTENQAATDAFESPEIAYQFSTHRFEDLSQAKHETESQPDHLLPFWLGSSALFETPSAHLISERKTMILPNWKMFELPEFSASGESRAPPFAA